MKDKTKVIDNTYKIQRPKIITGIKGIGFSLKKSHAVKTLHNIQE